MMDQRYRQFIMRPLWCSLFVGSLTISLTTARVTPGSERNTDVNRINNGQNVCLTKGCVKAAAKIISMIDDSADPCEDFERFACGTYLDNAIIPDEKSSQSLFTALNDELNQIVRKLLEEDITDEDTDATKIVKTYYSSCMDTDKMDERGLSPLQDILAKLGGWPVVEGDNWDPVNYQWTHTLYQNRELGYSYDAFFNLGFISDEKNSSWRILRIFQSGTYMQREDLLNGFNDSNIQAYYEYQLGIAELLGADRERAERELKEVIEFDAEIAKIILPPEEARKSSARYNKMTLFNLQMQVPDFPWYEYINKIVGPIVSVNASEPIVVYAMDVLKKMSALINITPKRTLANYIIWDVVKSSISRLNTAARDLQFEYIKKVYGVKKETPRWKTCVISLRSEIAVGAAYIRKYFKEDAKYASEEIIEYIHEAFNDKLRSLEWLDETTRNRALHKSKVIHSVIAYPEELLNDLEIGEYYDGLVLTKGTIFEQTLNISRFRENKILKKFRTKIDKRNWEQFGNVVQVNAGYNPSTNTIQFLAGFLRGAIFEAERPMYLNFAGIGSVVGHEITHGFDDQGKQRDANGDSHNWWEEETEVKYLNKAQCFIEQYGNFTVPELNLNINGKLTLGENIADNGGLKDAYYGYKKWVKDNGEEPLLPGLPYTPEQLFWISNANVWCSKSRPEPLRKQILTDSHSPGRFRIIGPMMNNVDFSKDFNCPVGAPMNPKNKCEVW